MDFLKALSTGAQVGGEIASLAKLFGLGKDRPSWRDMQFMMDTSERLAPRDIALQGSYLEGLAPHQANAYNEYQGATYGEDTQRQIDRIKTTGDQLGMSPWEIMGQGGAAPLPSPSFGGAGQAPAKQEFMSSIVPLKVAEMNNKAAIAQTAMQTATQERIASQQTAGGELPKKQALQVAAQTILADQQTRTGMAQEAQAWAQADLAKNSTMLASLETLAKWAGTTEINLPGLKQTSNNAYPALVRMYATLVAETEASSEPAARSKALSAYVAQMPADQFKQLERDAKRAARAALSLAGDTAKGFLDGIGSFFGQK